MAKGIKGGGPEPRWISEDSKKRGAGPSYYNRPNAGQGGASGGYSGPDERGPGGSGRGRTNGESGGGFTVSRTGAYSGEDLDKAAATTHFSDDPEEKKRRN